jgi:hypothetical protein
MSSRLSGIMVVARKLPLDGGVEDLSPLGGWAALD